MLVRLHSAQDGTERLARGATHDATEPRARGATQDATERLARDAAHVLHPWPMQAFSLDRILCLLLLVASLASVACEGDSSSPSSPGTTSPGTTAGGQPAEPPTAPPARIDTLAETASDPLASHFAERYPAALETILERRFLRVLTSRNAFDYFLEGGQPRGYQQRMVSAFTRFLNERHRAGSGQLPIQFELIPVDDDQLIPLLLEGAADLIAARLTITPDRAEQVAFSKPYRTTDEVLLTHDQTAPIASLEDLSGATVAVRESSSYHASLKRLNRRLEADGKAPIEIALVDEELPTERIVGLVAARRFPFTVVDSMIAAATLPLHPTLRRVKGLRLRSGAELAWATHEGADALVAELDRFLAGHAEGTLLGNMAYRRHFEPSAKLAARIAAESGDEIHISAYDALFREQAAQYELDWRLIASMAYQESRFDPTRRNRSGAVGLMQIKPSTAREPYVDIPNVAGREHVGDNIAAGVRYLAWIKQRYFDSVPEISDRDRLRMAIAAYNAGPRTILRARKRAEKMGLDPNRWFRNVERALLEMRKREPVAYVSDINQRYLSYVMLGIE